MLTKVNDAFEESVDDHSDVEVDEIEQVEATTILPEEEEADPEEAAPEIDNDEIAYDDPEVYFEEDFGTPVKNQAEVIVDPLDDIADVDKENEKVPFHPEVEFLETKARHYFPLETCLLISIHVSNRNIGINVYNVFVAHTYELNATTLKKIS